MQIAYGDDPAQFGRLRLPATGPSNVKDLSNGFAVVILVHGGFWKEPWDYTLTTPLAEALANEGYATWNVEFRRLGGRGGWPETFDDVAAAVDHVAVLARHHHVDPQRVVVVGHSAGGHLALWVLGARTSTVAPLGAIGLAPVIDLPETRSASDLLGGTVEDLPDRYRFAAPVLDPERVVVLHGDDDTIIDRSHADVASAAGVRVEFLPGVDHFDIIDSGSTAWPSIRREVAMMVGRSG